MRRREFIAALANTAAWPLAARAQQATPVIGFFSAGSAAGRTHLMAAFRRGLSEAGFVEGRNVAIEFAWAEDRYDRLPAMAAELVRRQVAVIATPGSMPAALAAKAATNTIPIVFAAGIDPVKFGLVTTLNRPGGNATGVSFLTGMLVAKQLQLLHDLVPQAAIVGYLINRSFPDTADQLSEVQAAARALGLALVDVNCETESDLGNAFGTLVRQGIRALLVQTDPFLFSHRAQLAALSLRHGLLTMYQLHDHVAAGGLMSYGPDLVNAWRLAGVYCGRILNGAKPADLPVEQAVKFQLSINLKTAKALGVDVPAQLQQLADEIIE